MALAGVGRREPRDENATTAERGRGVQRFGGGDSAVTEARARARDSRPDRTDDRVETVPRSARECRCRRHAGNVAVEARADRDRDLHQAFLAKEADRVGERHRERAARELEVGGADVGAESGAGRRELAVQRATDDRETGERTHRVAALLDVLDGRLNRRVRQFHHVRAGVGGELEPPCEVDRQDVEPSGAEPEVDRLAVDDDVVTQRDGAGEPRVCHAGAPSTSSLTRPSCRSTTALTRPRCRLSMRLSVPSREMRAPERQPEHAAPARAVDGAHRSTRSSPPPFWVGAGISNRREP